MKHNVISYWFWLNVRNLRRITNIRRDHNSAFGTNQFSQNSRQQGRLAWANFSNHANEFSFADRHISFENLCIPGVELSLDGNRFFSKYVCLYIVLYLPTLKKILNSGHWNPELHYLPNKIRHPSHRRLQHVQNIKSGKGFRHTHGNAVNPDSKEVGDDEERLDEKHEQECKTVDKEF